ncbi:MAG: hypothetical protein ACPGEC_01715, partial [Flavobacteriales bacterium]
MPNYFSFTAFFFFIFQLALAQFQLPEEILVCDDATTIDVEMEFTSSQSAILAAVSNATFTQLSLDDDKFSTTINLGFNFNFYGNTYSNCVISSNNTISFNTSNAGDGMVYTDSVPLGTSSSYDLKNSILAPFQDLNPQISGTIEYATIGSAPNRIFVARWYDVAMFSCNDLKYCSAVLLFEGSNTIETHLINKPDCSWQNGLAIHGLLNTTGSHSETVYDTDESVFRTYGETWSTNLDGTRFTPINSSNYNISTIDFLPVVSLVNLTLTDNLGNEYTATQNTTIQNYPNLDYVIMTSDVCAENLSDTSYFSDYELDVLVDGNAVNNVSICPSESATLEIENPEDFISYSWSTGSSSASISVSESGLYTLTALGNGCSLTSSVNVSIANIDVHLGSDTSFCENMSIVLNGTTSGATSYLWNTGATSPTISVDVAGTYTLQVSNAEGCTDSDTIIVSEVPEPTLDLGADTTLCGDTPFNIGGLVAGASYLWNTSATTSHISVNSSGTYILTVDIGPCSVSDTIILTFNDIPDVDLGDDISICEGDSTLIDAFLGDNYTYLWQDGSTNS